MMDEDLEPEPDVREQEFHNAVREYVIFLLLFLYMYLIGYYIVNKFRNRENEEVIPDSEEFLVYRICIWLCAFSLSVCLFAALLLPVSIVSNEVLLNYPTSYYIKWLNHSLIQGLWNMVFLFSNISLFILLPFSYLFIESEGFSGFRKGLKSRFYETIATLSLLIVILLGFIYIISAMVDKKNADLQTFFHVKSYYLPFLYSCISFIGVLLLLLCTPLGFARMFTIVSGCLVKPQFLQDINQDYAIAKLEEHCCRRRLQQANLSGKSYLNPAPMSTFPLEDEPVLQLQNGALQSQLHDCLFDLRQRSKVLDKRRKTMVFQRNVIYPLSIMLLVAITVITVLLVAKNTIELLIGIKALPVGTMEFTLGLVSLSSFGPVGAVLEVVMILFLAACSSVGLYCLPLICRIIPKTRRTTFHHIIANCALLIILSSALPLLARTLGITNFDLLGEYGQIEWLGNFKIVLSYNLVFGISTTLCIANKCSHAVRQQLYNRFHSTYRLWVYRSEEDLGRSSSTSIFSKKD